MLRTLIISAVIAILLSLAWDVPYIFTLIGLFALGFVGLIITGDEFLPGGWDNPDGKYPFPWKVYVIAFISLASLVAIAVYFPSIRSLGA